MLPLLHCPRTIDEWLADPLTQEVMRADRVNPGEFRLLLHSLARRHRQVMARSSPEAVRRGHSADRLAWPNKGRKVAALGGRSECRPAADSCGAG